MTHDTDISDRDQILFDRVNQIEWLIRPSVQSDGGDVEVTGEGDARNRLHGEWVGYPSSTTTLQMGIERNICGRVPEVIVIQQVQ